MKVATGHEDVISICKPHALPSTPVMEEDCAEQLVIRFVYLLRSGRYYKIGRSNAAGRRERELVIQPPEKAQTVHVIRTDGPVGIESYWHRRFEEKQKNGEWFELTPLDVKAFRRRKFM